MTVGSCPIPTLELLCPRSAQFRLVMLVAGPLERPLKTRGLEAGPAGALYLWWLLAIRFEEAESKLSRAAVLNYANFASDRMTANSAEHPHPPSC